MALIDCKFYSEVLKISTSVQVILPINNQSKIGNSDSPVLYLLHGLSENDTTWIRRTSIEKYVAEKNLVVVMPSAGRSFYTDMAYGYNYFTFITEELPKIMKQFFHISDKREDTFIAGNSMGGYGALKIALSCPERYSAAASLSGAVDIAAIYAQTQKVPNNPMMSSNELYSILGDCKDLRGSKHDLFYLATKLSEKSCEKPRIYQCCGTKDFIYPFNVNFKKFMNKQEFDYTYEEESGVHEWGFWDKKIQDVLKWINAK